MTGFGFPCSAMKKRPQAKPLSRTAEVELQRLVALCRKRQLSAATIRQIKRIVRILINEP